MLRQMTENNPQMRMLLENPDMMRAAFTPENMNMAMQMMGGAGGAGGAGALGGMGGMPGSF